MGYEDRGETGTQNVSDPDGAHDFPMGLIGGHQGMDVSRVVGSSPNGNRSIILKEARHVRDSKHQDLAGVDLYDLNLTALHNEAAMLDAMEGSGYTPELLDINEGRLWQSDVGAMQSPRDMEAWRRNCVRMLATIRAHGLRHGDLRGTNVITRGDWPWAVDWQESHRIGDVPPQKSPYSDSNLLMQHIEGTPGPNGQFDTPRVARRWRCVLDSLGASTNLTLPLKDKSFLDLGCFQGDFVALAAAEGMWSMGVDQGGFRSGENSIEIGRRLWEGFPFGEIRLREMDIAAMPHYYSDVVAMFSTWPYIVHDYGRKKAEAVIEQVIAELSVSKAGGGPGAFFFETQLAGDGPGPDFLPTDDAVGEMLVGCGAKVVKPIATFPVTGRPASRTVWRVEG